MRRYDLNSGLNVLTESIKEQADSKKGMLKVSFAGGSASGKSTGVKEIMERLRTLGFVVELISADGYSFGGKYATENGISFDDPEYINVKTIRADINQLDGGKDIFRKKYDFGDEPFYESEEIISPPDILLIEGLFVLRDDLRDLADIKVFFDIGLHGWILRRTFRDTARTGMMPADILSYCTETVEPKYRQWVLNTMQFADIVIENEYNPEIEAKNSGRHEVQLKYKSSLNEEELIHELLKLGGDRLAVVRQIDTYYNPRDRNLRETGESMRIRNEDLRIIWTYKGPKNKDNLLSVRSKYEFEISRDFMKKFLDLYGEEIKIIKKIRTMFLLGSLVITVDNVVRIENGIEEDLGIFLEFRTNTKTTDTKILIMKIENILNNIGLESARAENRSYVEI
ncbi:CYTH domain-containing protein [Candidatus Parcubacteria bacterium]|nr:CYTH domain-containing protein [Candidatus Parcubacteria bacterium]